MSAVTFLDYKVCAKCKEPKTFDQFYLRNYKPNGWCKECSKTRGGPVTRAERSRWAPLVEGVNELLCLGDMLVDQEKAMMKIENALEILKKQGVI
jgi:hypothetical protein